MSALKTTLFAGWCIIATCIFFIQPVFAQPVNTGAEVLLSDYIHELRDARVGLVMNPTARIGQTHMLDTLLTYDVDVVALFSPEHGFRGNFGAGERIADGIDEASGLPVFSLYGNTRKPDEEMLDGIDVLIFDMQDVGARFYTYISTLGLVMEAASENGVSVWVLDRPNPAGGNYVAGWILEPDYSSFVGMYPIPIAHGMTIGEIALMIKSKQWVSFEGDLDLKIIPMKGWNRDMKWDDTGLAWFPPSPNLPTPFHAWIYLGTCLIEGTNMSEGRGTDDPFLLFGSPTLNTDSVLAHDWQKYYNITLTAENFTPVSIPGRALSPKHENKENQGLRVAKPSGNGYPEKPVEFGVDLLRVMLKYDSEAKTNSFLKLLTGTSKIESVLQSSDFGNISDLWADDVERFLEKRAPFLLY